VTESGASTIPVRFVAAINTGQHASILRSTESWGTGTVVPEVEQKEAFLEAFREAFLETLDKFQNSLSDAYVAINDNVELYKFVPAVGDKAFQLDCVCGPQDYSGTYAENPDVIGQLEALLDSWCKQIEQVLAESEQMRKEADDVGPRAELEHWKRRMAKFNGLLLELIKSPTCTSTVGHPAVPGQVASS
jgi:dynein heavy chain